MKKIEVVEVVDKKLVVRLNKKLRYDMNCIIVKNSLEKFKIDFSVYPAKAIDRFGNEYKLVKVNEVIKEKNLDMRWIKKNLRFE